MVQELDLDELRATYDHPTDRSVIELIDRLEQAEQDRDKLRNRLDAMRRQRDGYQAQARKAEQAVARVREVAAEYRPSIPEEVLHEVMKDILEALDGDTRADV